jgi:hypothetical protein
VKLDFTIRIRLGIPSGQQSAAEYGDGIFQKIGEQDWRIYEISTSASETSSREALVRSFATTGGYLWRLPLFIQPKKDEVS